MLSSQCTLVRQVILAAAALSLSPFATAQASGSSAACNNTARSLSSAAQNDYSKSQCNTELLEIAIPGLKSNPIPEECNQSWLFRDKPHYICNQQVGGQHCKTQGELSHRENWGFNPPTDPCPAINSQMVKSIKDLIKSGDVEKLAAIVACQPMKKLSEGNDWSAFQSDCAGTQGSGEGSGPSPVGGYLPSSDTPGFHADPLGSPAFSYFIGDPHSILPPGTLALFDDGTQPIPLADLPVKLRDMYLAQGPIEAVTVRGSWTVIDHAVVPLYSHMTRFTAKVSAEGDIHTVSTGLVPTEGELLPVTREVFFDGANTFLHRHGLDFVDLWPASHQQVMLPLATIARYGVELVDWARDPLDLIRVPGFQFTTTINPDGSVEVLADHPGLTSTIIGPCVYRWGSVAALHPTTVTYFNRQGQRVLEVSLSQFMQVGEGAYRPFCIDQTRFEPVTGLPTLQTVLELQAAAILPSDALRNTQPPTTSRKLWRIWNP